MRSSTEMAMDTDDRGMGTQHEFIECWVACCWSLVDCICSGGKEQRVSRKLKKVGWLNKSKVQLPARGTGGGAGQAGTGKNRQTEDGLGTQLGKRAVVSNAASLVGLTGGEDYGDKTREGEGEGPREFDDMSGGSAGEAF